MNKLIKRMCDVIISLFFIVFFIPLFIIISIAIKIDSTGTVIFTQKRLKRNGEMFKMYKFRSMIQDAEKKGTGLFNYKNDFRVTKVGAFLRKSSLDELPQLFNVLKGDMSLVGPRPPVSYELGDYQKLNSVYKKRFTIRPGITGLAQITGRNDLEWDEKVIYDNKYIELFEKYGILIDIVIILKTIINVFLSKDIYEEMDESMIEASDEEKKVKASEKVLSKAREENK